MRKRPDQEEPAVAVVTSRKKRFLESVCGKLVVNLATTATPDASEQDTRGKSDMAVAGIQQFGCVMGSAREHCFWDRVSSDP